MTSGEHERCSWCGVAIDAEDGFRATEPIGERVAAFCRLEHVVPWTIQGAHWDAGRLAPPDDPALDRCAQCGEPAGEARIVLIRHRAERRIADAFCRLEHLRGWAQAGGRWR